MKTMPFVLRMLHKLFFKVISAVTWLMVKRVNSRIFLWLSYGTPCSCGFISGEYMRSITVVTQQC